MSEKKFTKGPWGIEQTKTTNWIGPMRKSGDGKIAEIVCSTNREDLELAALEREDANAALIAASPELFEALEACIPTLESVWMLTGSKSRKERLDQARAALAKATPKGGNS